MRNYLVVGALLFGAVAVAGEAQIVRVKPGETFTFRAAGEVTVFCEADRGGAQEVFSAGGIYSYAVGEDCARIESYPRILVALPVRGRLLKAFTCGNDEYVVVGDILGDFPDQIYTFRRKDVVVTDAVR